MRTKNMSVIMTLLMLIALAVSACGSSDKPNPSNAIPAAAGVKATDVKALWDKARTYYNEGTTQEMHVTQLWSAYQQKLNTLKAGALDLANVNQACFGGVAATESAIADAVMKNKDGSALVDALATGSVSGEQATTECARQNRQIADYIIANRAAVQDAYNANFNAATGYMNYTTNFPEVQIMNDLAKTYGSPTDLYKGLADHGIPGVTDWTWLPTKNLWVAHSDEALCNYYISGEFKKHLPMSTQRMFSGHESALETLYESSWNPVANGGRGECRMTRYAALEYMTRPIVSAGTRQDVQNGEDSGSYPTATPSK